MKKTLFQFLILLAVAAAAQVVQEHNITDAEWIKNKLKEIYALINENYPGYLSYDLDSISNSKMSETELEKIKNELKIISKNVEKLGGGSLTRIENKKIREKINVNLSQIKHNINAIKNNQINTQKKESVLNKFCNEPKLYLQGIFSSTEEKAIRDSLLNDKELKKFNITNASCKGKGTELTLSYMSFLNPSKCYPTTYGMLSCSYEQPYWIISSCDGATKLDSVKGIKISLSGYDRKQLESDLKDSLFSEIKILKTDIKKVLYCPSPPSATLKIPTIVKETCPLKEGNDTLRIPKNKIDSTWKVTVDDCDTQIGAGIALKSGKHTLKFTHECYEDIDIIFDKNKIDEKTFDSLISKIDVPKKAYVTFIAKNKNGKTVNDSIWIDSRVYNVDNIYGLSLDVDVCADIRVGIDREKLKCEKELQLKQNSIETCYYEVTKEDIGPKMIDVAGGIFSIADGFPKIEIKPFSIGTHEVTQELWEYVMEYENKAGSAKKETIISKHRDEINPKWSTNGCDGKNRPMFYISMNQVREFIKKLNNITGKNYRLPTELEWEYVARGGKNNVDYSYEEVKEKKTRTDGLIGYRIKNTSILKDTVKYDTTYYYEDIEKIDSTPAFTYTRQKYNKESVYTDTMIIDTVQVKIIKDTKIDTIKYKKHDIYIADTIKVYDSQDECYAVEDISGANKVTEITGKEETIYGILGNVWEWVDEWFMNPKIKTSDYCIVRGYGWFGSFGIGAGREVRSCGNAAPTEEGHPTKEGYLKKGRFIGFRLAHDKN